MFSSAIYRYSPRWAQEALIAGRAFARATLREGRQFNRDCAAVADSQWLDAPALAEFRAARLRQVVAHAGRHSAFYRERFAAAGVRPDDIRTEADLGQLPLLTKDDVREAGAALLANPGRHRLVAGGTSGTTGTPLRIVQDFAAIAREHAFTHRQLTWAGYTPGGRRAWLRGDLVVPVASNRAPFWRLNRADNMLMFSSYHLSDASAAGYLDALADFDPAIIQAYPSSIGFLANWLASADGHYAGRNLRGIVTSSESLTPQLRAIIAERFRCRVYDWYGQFERVAAIGTCERGNYHVMSDYSLSEFLPVGDNLYEVVGTGFNNLVMPLIRYRTGDLVELAAPGFRCDCQRSFPVVRSILGRQDDVVVLPDGRRIGRLDHLFKGLSGIIEAQIRQETTDTIRILVVPGPGFDNATRDRLQKNAEERLGNLVTVAVATVPTIARSRNGKFRAVVSSVG